MSMNLNYLELKNIHERDSQIMFDEEKHKYTILCDKESDYISVTTWLHSHFEKFDADVIIDNMMKSKNWKNNKYYGMTKEEIKQSWDNNCKEASEAGTKMHYYIECYYNKLAERSNEILRENIEDKTIFDSSADISGAYARRGGGGDGGELSYTYVGEEYEYFMKFASDYKNLVPYRTEWRIWHEDIKLAGSIDMVFQDISENIDGNGNEDENDVTRDENENNISLLIYDWKRCKNITKSSFNKYSITECISHIPDSNYWHYCLQLNIYKRILEDKYNKKIGDMYLVCLHPNNTNKSYQRIKVVDLSEEVDNLFEYRKSLL